MPLWGFDLSHWQGPFNFGTAKAEEFSFCFIKATEGATFQDSLYRNYMNQAMGGFTSIAAYHYLTTDDINAQADNVCEQVNDTSMSIMLDVEKDSGDFDNAVALIQELKNRDYAVPLLYLPRWYWEQIGQPDLGGAPHLVASDYVHPGRRSHDHYASVLYGSVDDSYWAPYGGVEPSILQFSNVATVAYHNRSVDVSAYRGSEKDLYTLF